MTMDTPYTARVLIYGFFLLRLQNGASSRRFSISLGLIIITVVSSGLAVEEPRSGSPSSAPLFPAGISALDTLAWDAAGLC